MIHVLNVLQVAATLVSNMPREILNALGLHMDCCPPITLSSLGAGHWGLLVAIAAGLQ
jgi:hypothetical protein